MNEKDHAIDEYVRRVSPVMEGALGGLADPRAKYELLDRIRSLPAADAPASGISRAPRVRRPRLALAGAAAGVLLLGGGAGAVAVLGGYDAPGGDPPPVTSGPEVDESVALESGAMDCAVDFGPETLAERALAFDGTVVAIEPILSSMDGFDHEGAEDPMVTFRVEQWFRGVAADQISVAMPEQVTSLDNPTYQVGSRLLVAGEYQGEDPVVWFCGFTRTYSAGAAEQWRLVFATG